MAQRSSILDESQPRSEFWRDQSAAWESSGLTQADFCEERDLSLPAFRWWRWKLKREAGSLGIRLVPVRVVDPGVQSSTLSPGSRPAPPSSPFEVFLESGIRIRVPADFDEQALSRLLRTLEATEC